SKRRRRAMPCSKSASLLGKDDMRGALGRRMLDSPISQRAEIEAVEERFPLAERDRRLGEVEFIDMAGLNILPYRLDAAADLDVLGAGRLARLLQRSLDTVGDEVEGRAAQHLDRRARIMGQDEGRRVIGRVVAPPALPLIVRPFAANGAEHV